MPSAGSRARRATVGGILLLLLTSITAACARLDGADESGLPGSLNVLELTSADRQDPVSVEGRSLGGDPVDTHDLRGRVVVVNVWGAWCAECRVEAPILAQVSKTSDAAFVGIDVRDSSSSAGVAFEKQYGIGYPSIFDQGGVELLEFGRYSPSTTPSTIVLDRAGRVASLVSGVVTSAQTLEDLIDAAGTE